MIFSAVDLETHDSVILKFCKVKLEFEKEKAIPQYLNSFPDAPPHVRLNNVPYLLYSTHLPSAPHMCPLHFVRTARVMSVLGFNHVLTLLYQTSAHSLRSTTTGR